MATAVEELGSVEAVATSKGVRPVSCFRQGRVYCQMRVGEGRYRWLGSLVVRPATSDDDVIDEVEEHGFAIAKGPGDKSWREHTVNAAEMVEMRANWRTWVKAYGRKCMPDWSICLLHPEDCNLR